MVDFNLEVRRYVKSILKLRCYLAHVVVKAMSSVVNCILRLKMAIKDLKKKLNKLHLKEFSIWCTLNLYWPHVHVEMRDGYAAINNFFLHIAWNKRS